MRYLAAAIAFFSVLALGLFFCVLQRPAADTAVVAKIQNHINAIAATPHPVGSAPQRDVQHYITAQLEKAGHAVLVQQSEEVSHYSGYNFYGKVTNLIVRIKGSNSQGALLFTAHYDSIHYAPGAADDALGVAVLLALAEKLENGVYPKDIILLFSDGEEYGLLGAKAFTEHPYFKDVVLAVNIDNRGSCGMPVVMQRSGLDTAALNALFSVDMSFAAPQGVVQQAQSQELLSDFLPFSARVPALTVGLIDCAYRYHRVTDSAQYIDPVSLQKEFAVTGQLLTQAMTMSLPQVMQESSTVVTLALFKIAFRGTLLVILTLLLVFAAGFLLFRRAMLQRQFFITVPVVVGGTFAASLAGFELINIGSVIESSYLVFVNPYNGLLLGGLLFIFFAAAAFLLSSLSIPISSGAIVVVVLSCVALAQLPSLQWCSVIYLFLTIEAALCVVFTGRMVRMICITSALLVLVPEIYFGALFAGMQKWWPLFPAIFLQFLLIAESVKLPRAIKAAIAAVTVSVVLFFVCVMIPSFDKDFPQFFTVMHYADITKDTAKWLMHPLKHDRRFDSFVNRRSSELIDSRFYRYVNFHSAPAPQVEWHRPVVTVARKRLLNGMTEVTADVSSIDPAAAFMQLRVTHPALVSATLNSHRLLSKNGELLIRLEALTAQPHYLLTLVFSREVTAELGILLQTAGLPPELEEKLPVLDAASAYEQNAAAAEILVELQ